MRNKIFLLGGVALVVYVLSSQERKAKNKNYEDLRHQLERLWTDPKAVKARARTRKELATKSRKLAKKTAKAIRATAAS